MTCENCVLWCSFNPERAGLTASTSGYQDRSCLVDGGRQDALVVKDGNFYPHQKRTLNDVMDEGKRPHTFVLKTLLLDCNWEEECFTSVPKSELLDCNGSTTAVWGFVS